MLTTLLLAFSIMSKTFFSSGDANLVSLRRVLASFLIKLQSLNGD